MKRFIVGTDTDVGKTYYGRLLMKEGCHVIKPIETGRLSFEDLNESDSYGYAIGQGLAIHEVNLHFFEKPVSPHFACELEDFELDIEGVKDFVEKAHIERKRDSSDNNLIIELAGGLMVPLYKDYTQLDFIQSFDDGVVDLVIANKLGCLNHTLMTMKILKEAGIKIHTIVINNLNKKPTAIMDNNIKTIKEWADLESEIRLI